MKVFISLEQIKDMQSRASTDETRPHLCVITIDTDTGRMYTTDGHRMAVRKHDGTDISPPDYEQSLKTWQPEISVRINTADMWARVKKRMGKGDDVFIIFESAHLSIQTVDGDVSITCDILPKDGVTSGGSGERICVQAKYLLDALTALKQYLTVDICYCGGLGPVIITPYWGSDIIEVLMPQTDK